jgi:drug/metabolite transporter (DMT)-like permease
MVRKTIGAFNVFLMVCLITFWGSSFVVVKLALREGLTPIAVATFRFLVAGGLFAVAILLKKAGERSYVVFVEKNDLPKLIFLAFTGVTFFFVVQYTGIQMAGASVASILVCLLAPILISVLSAKLFKERLTRKQTLGIGIAAVGTLAMVGSGAFNLQANMSSFLGSLILLSTPVMWAAYTVGGKKIMEKYSPFLVVTYVSILGAVCLVPFSLAENSLLQILVLSFNEWLAILFLSFTSSLLGYSIWFYVMNRVEAALASSFLFAEPVVTVLFATVFVGEEMTIFTLAGSCLIFFGVYLVTRK